MFRQSRAPQSVGSCSSDQPRLASLVNEASQMLLEAGGEVGFWGTWGRFAFNVDPCAPYLTLPRSLVRMINAAICKTPIRIQNGLYELLEFGVGPQPEDCGCQLREAYDRGTFPTLKDLDNKTNKKCIRFYLTDQRDIGKRILVQGVDTNGTVLRSLDNGIDVEGVYVRLEAPFVDTEFLFGANTSSKITGLQKDITVGDVRVYEVDTVTGASVSLSVLEPSEETTAYRRYFLNGLPANCCAGETTVQITAMCKFAFVPVTVDQDWLIIGNIPALKRACESVRYAENDSPESHAMSRAKWQEAIRLLNRELDHHMGKHRPAIRFSPFGHDTLECAGIGQLI